MFAPLRDQRREQDATHMVEIGRATTHDIAVLHYDEAEYSYRLGMWQFRDDFAVVGVDVPAEKSPAEWLHTMGTIASLRGIRSAEHAAVQRHVYEIVLPEYETSIASELRGVFQEILDS